MNLSDRFKRSSENCFEIASGKSFLVGAFIGAAALAPVHSGVALGVLGAPAFYGFMGFAQDMISKGFKKLGR